LRNSKAKDKLASKKNVRICPGNFRFFLKNFTQTSFATDTAKSEYQSTALTYQNHRMQRMVSRQETAEIELPAIVRISKAGSEISGF